MRASRTRPRGRSAPAMRPIRGRPGGAPRGRERRRWRCSRRSWLVSFTFLLHGLAHHLGPVGVLADEQALVLAALAAEQGLHAQAFGVLVGALEPQWRAAAQVVPLGCLGGITGLAGAEFLQVVGRAHAGDIEEVLVLAYARGAVLGALALGGEAVDGDLGLVHADGARHADLRGELVHQVHVGVEAQVARLANDGVRLVGAQALGQLLAAVVDRAHLGVHGLRPQQDVAVLEAVDTAHTLAPAARIHGLGAAFLAPAHGGGVVPVHGADVVAVGAVFHLQLPVAVVDVGGIAAQHLQR